MPALTILISHMGDTLFHTFSDMTNWIFKHVLPQKNLRDSAQATLEKAKDKLHNFGKTSREEHMTADEHCRHVVRTFSERLEAHIDEDELKELSEANQEGMCARTFAVTTILCGVLRSWRLQTRKSAANYIIHKDWAICFSETFTSTTSSWPENSNECKAT